MGLVVRGVRRGGTSRPRWAQRGEVPRFVRDCGRPGASGGVDEKLKVGRVASGGVDEKLKVGRVAQAMFLRAASADLGGDAGVRRRIR